MGNCHTSIPKPRDVNCVRMEMLSARQAFIRCWEVRQHGSLTDKWFSLAFRTQGYSILVILRMPNGSLTRTSVHIDRIVSYTSYTYDMIVNGSYSNVLSFDMNFDWLFHTGFKNEEHTYECLKNVLDHYSAQPFYNELCQVIELIRRNHNIFKA